MMKSLIAIAALVASVSASAGELDGKAILCLNEDDGIAEVISPVTLKVYRGFRFVNDKVEGDILRVESSKAVIGGFGGDDKTFVNQPTSISWWYGDDGPAYTLDRQTLEVTFSGLGPDDTYPCESYQSLDEYWNAWEKVRVEEQSAIDNVMKDNKI